MNQEKLKQLQSAVRIGGKGTARRKKKVVHKTGGTDEKKLQSTFKKLGLQSIPGIEEVNMIKEDGSVIHFNNPKVQASIPSNTFTVVGQAENKQITDMLPGILNQLGAESLTHLRRLAAQPFGMVPPGSGFAFNPSHATVPEDYEDDVPELIGDFDEPSKQENVTANAGPGVVVEAPKQE